MAMRETCWRTYLFVLLAAVTVPTGAAYGRSLQRWSGTAVRGVFQTRHFVANNGTATWDDTSTYRGRFSFHFTVSADGTIAGGGSGTYLLVKWHEQGTASGGGSFSCDAPKTAQPYQVMVSGRVSGGRMLLRLSLPQATEVLAQDVNCDANHKLFAGTTTYLRDSLAAVVGRGLSVSTKRRVTVLQLKKHKDYVEAAAPQTIPPGTNHVIQDHAWTISVHR